MRLHRFYVSHTLTIGKELTVTEEGLLHQWGKVFRFKTGDKVILFDGSGIECEAEIVEITRKEARVLVVTQNKREILPKREVHLYFSLAKKDTAELVIQKCTELGVASFHPILSDRSEKKGFNMERAEKILIE